MVGYKKYFFRVLFIVLILNFSVSYGQSKMDTLQKNNFKDLVSKFYNYEQTPKLASVYANEYLKRAKRLKDTIRIADGYYFLASISKENIFLKFNDSIVNLTKEIKEENKFYPILGYFNKGDYYYKRRKFNLALENYLLAYNSKVNRNSLNYIFDLKYRIGLLKSRYGNDDDALSLFKDVYKYHIKNKFNINKSHYYFPILFALSDSYLRNGLLDSAYYYNKKGYSESIKLKDSINLNYFIFEQGLIEFSKHNYKSSIDSIQKTLSKIKQNGDYANLAYGNYYIGLSHIAIGKPQKAIPFFIKVDSVFDEIKDIHPDLRKSYTYLIDFYKEKKDIENELKYVKKLLEVDKILTKNYKKVTKNLTDKYDTPELVSKKDFLISKLEIKISNNNIYLILITCISLIIFIFSVNQYLKKREIKMHLKKLLNDSSYTSKKKEIRKKGIAIPKEVVKDILQKLKKLEKNKTFISNKISLSSLSVNFNTNTKYLSVIINNNKHTNFSNYINNLRIDYVVEKLKSDHKFRRYSIKAIGEDVGFSNSESFSKAFYRKTGIQPSLFVKELNKTSLDS